MKMVKQNPRMEQVEELLHNLGLERLEELEDFPRFVQIETVARCNARCAMCTINDWQRRVDLMPDSLFARIAEELGRYADTIRMVTVQLDGEPLLDPALESRIALLKQQGMRKVAFSTNGALLTAQRGSALLDSGLDEITFSIDGATAATYERIRSGLKFDVVCQRIEDFIRQRDERQSPLAIRIRMTLQEENRAEFAAYLAYWNRLLGPQDRAYGKLLHSWGNQLEGGSEAERAAADQLNRLACISPFGTLLVLCDGRVPLCCNDFNARVELGDVNRDALATIWRGEEFARIRLLHREKGRLALPMCHNCNVWDDASCYDAEHPLPSAEETE